MLSAATMFQGVEMSMARERLLYKTRKEDMYCFTFGNLDLLEVLIAFDKNEGDMSDFVFHISTNWLTICLGGQHSGQSLTYLMYWSLLH